MLTILGKSHSGHRFCDGMSRRNFLKIGGLGVGLSLADLFALEAKAGIRNSKKSIIIIYLLVACSCLFGTHIMRSGIQRRSDCADSEAQREGNRQRDSGRLPKQAKIQGWRFPVVGGRIRPISKPGDAEIRFHARAGKMDGPKTAGKGMSDCRPIRRQALENNRTPRHSDGSPRHRDSGDGDDSARDPPSSSSYLAERSIGRVGFAPTENRRLSRHTLFRDRQETIGLMGRLHDTCSRSSCGGTRAKGSDGSRWK